MSIEDFFELAAAALSEELGLSSDALMKRFLDRETASSTVIAPGLAIPHVLVNEKGHFHVLIARCSEGIAFPNQRESVHTVFMLVRSRDERNFYLRALAAIAQTVQAPEFEVKWLQAGGAEDLRNIVLQSERRRFAEQIDLPEHNS
jgi:mannitol/fructose-specific phosphotransferase system IIA component (Ntr-type)